MFLRSVARALPNNRDQGGGIRKDELSRIPRRRRQGREMPRGAARRVAVRQRHFSIDCVSARSHVMVGRLCDRKPLKIGNDAMHSELSDACLNAIQKATKPISLSEIGAACLGRSKPNAKLEEVLKQLVGRAVIHEWPTYRKSRLFDGRPLRSAVESAFVAVLDDAPLTIAQAAKPVRDVLNRVSEKSVLSELRGVAPKLAAARKIIQVPVNRQTVVYMSVPYLGRIVPAKPAATEQTIIDAVTRLQPGPGNYVRVDQLRQSADVRGLIDATVIALADQSKLVLAPYGGPRPVTDEERSRYVEDGAGHLFIAIPRHE